MPNASLSIDGTEIVRKVDGVTTLKNTVLDSSVDTVSNTGAGYKPAEVWLSTTTVTSDTTYVTLPTGYKKYRLSGSDIHFLGNNGSFGYVRVYFRYNSTDDTAVQSGYRLRRLDTTGGVDGNHDGYVMLADNQGNDTTDNSTFDIIMDQLTISGRTRGYRITYNSSYGHTGDQHSYAILGGAYSQTTTVIDEIKLYLNAQSGSFTGYGGSLILTGYTF